MNALRMALLGCVLLSTASFALAQDKKDKIDSAKLVGTWTFVKTTSKDGPPEDSTTKVEFTKDGKVNVVITYMKKDFKQSGSYKVEGNKLTTVMKDDKGKDKTEVAVIKELTDKKLVTEEKEGGKTVSTEFKK